MLRASVCRAVPAAEGQVLGDGEGGEDLPALGHLRQSRAFTILCDGQLGDVLAAEPDAAPARPQQPETAFRIEVFPAPLAPTSVTRAPAGTWKETFRTASTPAVVHLQPLDREDRLAVLAHRSASGFCPRGFRRVEARGEIGDRARGGSRSARSRGAQVRLEHRGVAGDVGRLAAGDGLAEVSTMILSQVSSIIRTLCSMTRMPMPSAASDRISSDSLPASTRFIPAAGSSSTAASDASPAPARSPAGAGRRRTDRRPGSAAWSARPTRTSCAEAIAMALRSIPPGGGQEDQAPGQRAGGDPVAADEHVFQRRQPAEQLDLLEGAGHPAAGEQRAASPGR